MPALPDGYVAQPTSRRDVGARCYELHMAYDPNGRLDQRRCFWLAASLVESGRPVLRHVTFAELADTVSFGEFTRWALPTARLEEWLDAAIDRRARGPVRPTASHVFRLRPA